MTVTRDELNRFHDFAVSVVSRAESEVTWRQLFELWRLENPSVTEFWEDIAAIQESLDAMEAGRARPLSAFDADFRQRHGIVGNE